MQHPAIVQISYHVTSGCLRYWRRSSMIKNLTQTLKLFQQCSLLWSSLLEECFSTCFKKWALRLGRCISSERRYFGKKKWFIFCCKYYFLICFILLFLRNVLCNIHQLWRILIIFTKIKIALGQVKNSFWLYWKIFKI